MSSLERARRLHLEQPLVVAHVDLPAELQLRRQYGEPGALLRDYLPRCRKAGIGVLIGAVFVPPAYLPDMALSMGLEQIAALLAEIEESGGAFRLARTARELDACLEAGKVAVLLSMEGCEPLGRSPSLLRVFYELGVRLLGLPWNHRPAAADGCGEQGGGLTRMGRELVEAAWGLGMALDVSHLNDAGFDGLLALGDGPVLASHSNCRALCPHLRNLTDGQLRRLAARGGVVGVNQTRFLVKEKDAALEDLLAHVLYVEKYAGPGVAGLGLDLARPYMEALPRPHAVWRGWDPREEDLLPDYGALEQLTAAMLDAGLGREAVKGVLGGNFLRFLRRALP